jgi:CBS domain-containing protein
MHNLSEEVAVMLPTARDLMQAGVISVSPETPLLDVHRLFVEEEISGAPVTDNTGTLWSGSPEDLQDRLADRRVEEAMTPGVVSVEPKASAPEVARVLRENRIHRVFVVEDGRMVGVISAFDVLRLVEEWKTP